MDFYCLVFNYLFVNTIQSTQLLNIIAFDEEKKWFI